MSWDVAKRSAGVRISESRGPRGPAYVTSGIAPSTARNGRPRGPARMVSISAVAVDGCVVAPSCSVSATAAAVIVIVSSIAKAIDLGDISGSNLMIRTVTPRDRGRPQPKSHSLPFFDSDGCYKWRRRRSGEMDFAVKLELLRQTPYLRSVPASDIEELARRLPERRYQAGDVIFRKGDTSEGLAVVLSGRVRTVTTS